MKAIFGKALFGLAAAGLLLTSAPAFAQAPPGGVPLGAGLQRGVEELNNSGQVGFVTLFNEGGQTRIVTDLQGTMPGRTQTVAIQRGHSCDEIQPGIVARTSDLSGGMSRGVINMPSDRLLSGNYLVIVYSNNGPGAKMVACGQLYRS